MPRRDILILIATFCWASTAAAGADGLHADVVTRPAADRSPDHLGFVAPAIAADHFADSAARALRAEKALPAAWDARALGLVTPVKSQGACGACYAFSSAGDLESKLLLEGAGEYDLSENSMKECHYQDSSCGGGNQYLIMNHLTTEGAVLEACDPYVASDVACALGCAGQFVVLDWSAISGSSIPAVDLLKQHLMDNGPLQTTIYAGDGDDPSWYSTFTGYNGNSTLYYPAQRTPNHSVLLVGWDDSLVHAGGTGAWIVKNSWGTNWGGACGYGVEKGYFTIAYGSASIGMWSSFVGQYMPKDPAMDVLGHDEGGHTASWGGVGNTLWGLARHDMTEDTFLHRVEFWAGDAMTDVDVYVYDSFTGGLLGSQLASSVNHSFAEPGYHHVELDSPLALSAGQDVYIAVRFTTVSYNYPLTIDLEGPASTDHSWYSVNGASWTSLSSQGADVTIRARVSTSTVLSLEDQDSEDVPEAVALPLRLSLDEAWPNPFNPSTNLRYELPRPGRALVTVYDLHGRTVRTLFSGDRPAGEHVLVWDGMDDAGLPVSSGVYFAAVEADGQKRTTKLALLK